MTPKERAKELQRKFRTLDLTINDDTFVTRKGAKQYALLCIDETHKAELKVIENISEYLPIDIYTQAVIMSQKKKLEVKQEIEKI